MKILALNMKCKEMRADEENSHPTSYITFYIYICIYVCMCIHIYYSPSQYIFQRHTNYRCITFRYWNKPRNNTGALSRYLPAYIYIITNMFVYRASSVLYKSPLFSYLNLFTDEFIACTYSSSLYTFYYNC